MKRILNARPFEDDRNLRFKSRDVIARQPEQRKVWRGGPVLDQGSTPACMGFGLAGELIAAPQGDFRSPTSLGNELGLAIYRWMIENAQKLDGDGFFGAFGLKYGLYSEYRWPTNLDELRDALIAEGPVVISVPWFNSMSSPSWFGQLKVKPHSNPGYHCVFLRGYDPKKQFKHAWKKSKSFTAPAFLIRNSWGSRWGKKGDVWVTANDLDTLLTYNGRKYETTAFVPVGRKPVDVSAVLAQMKQE